MGKLFFTADTHYCHPLMAKLRGFGEDEEAVCKMNEKLVRGHNERVRADDQVFVLGDFLVHGYKPGPGKRRAATEFIDKLHGNLIFIRGNHDTQNGVPAYIESAQIVYGGHIINMTHRPEDYAQAFPLNLVGHVHSAWKVRGMIDGTTLVNVGVDQWDFHPINIQEINKAIRNGL